MCKSVFRNWTKNLFFWVVLILLAGANIYSISHQAGQRNEEISGHEAVYSEFKGTLTRDKILTVVKRYRQLKKLYSPRTIIMKVEDRGLIQDIMLEIMESFNNFMMNINIDMNMSLMRKR